MKTQAFLLLPFALTLFNVLFAAVLIFRDAAQSNGFHVPTLPESPPGFAETCSFEGKPWNPNIISTDGGTAPSVTPHNVDASPVLLAETPHANHVEEEASSPTLEWMPRFNFQAYTRRGISTFYGEEPGTREEQTPAFTGQAGKFINLSDRRLDLHWTTDNGDGRYIGHAGPFEATGTATAPGHHFFFAPHGTPDQVVCRFAVNAESMVYFYDPFSKDEGEPGRCKIQDDEPLMSLETLTEAAKEAYNAHRLNLEFAKAYKEFTGGSEWLTMFPRSKPLHHIWGADSFGQTHSVQTKQTQFITLPPEHTLVNLGMDDLRRNESGLIIPFQAFRTPESTMNITMTVVSCEPRIFEIPHFLSDVEIDHIIDVAQRQSLHRSKTGNSAKDVNADVDSRTSTNTWVSRYSSPIVDTVYRRIADMLKLDEALLRHRFPDEHPHLGTTEPISEELQLVHYDVGQEYTAHHDFGYPERSHKNSPSRSINVLMYLNEGMEGGETSFPRWRNAETSGALNVKPEKGKAVIFYMLTPDGNMDELSQHAALPVRRGEKWLANLWIHDPIKV